MDNNGNQPANPNQFLGRGVPIDERLGDRFECRKCHDFFANIRRHETACNGIVKPYRCPICMVGYNKEAKVRNHFRVRHRHAEVPDLFLNPDFRHRPARRRVIAAAPVAPGEDHAQEDHPQEGDQPHGDAGDVVADADGNAALVNNDPPPLEPLVVNVGLLEQGEGLNPLLRANLTANIMQIRALLGSDLSVIRYVSNVLENPDLFQL